MTVPVEDFVQQLIDEAISKRMRASTKKKGGRKVPFFVNCEVVVDNAIMPSCSLRNKTRSCSCHQPTLLGKSPFFTCKGNHGDEPVALPSRSSSSTTTKEYSASLSSSLLHDQYDNDDRRTSLVDHDGDDTMSSPRIMPFLWNEYSSLDCLVDRSPQSVLLPATPRSSKKILPPVSPRSARWTSSSTPPRTFLKTKSGLKRLDSDSPLACPQRMLLSPGVETSSN